MFFIFVIALLFSTENYPGENTACCFDSERNIEVTYLLKSDQLCNDLQKLHPAGSNFGREEKIYLPAELGAIQVLDSTMRLLEQNESPEFSTLVGAWKVADQLSMTSENTSMHQLTNKILESGNDDKVKFLQKNEDRDTLVIVLMQHYFSDPGNIETRWLQGAVVRDTKLRSVFLKTIGMPLAILTAIFHPSVPNGYADYAIYDRWYKLFSLSSPKKSTENFAFFSFLCLFGVFFNVIPENMGLLKAIRFFKLLGGMKWFLKSYITAYTNIPQNLLYSLGIYSSYKLLSYLIRPSKKNWIVDRDNTYLQNQIEQQINDEDTSDSDLSEHDGLYQESFKSKICKNEAQGLYSYFNTNSMQYYTKQKKYATEKIYLPNQCVACIKLSDTLYILGDATQHEVQGHQDPFHITTLWLGQKEGNEIKKCCKLWEPLLDDLWYGIAPIIRTGNWKPYIDTVMTREDESGRLWLYASTPCGEEFYFPLTPTDDPTQFRKEDINFYRKISFIKEVGSFALFWSACHFIHVPTVFGYIVKKISQCKTIVDALRLKK